MQRMDRNTAARIQVAIRQTRLPQRHEQLCTVQCCYGASQSRPRVKTEQRPKGRHTCTHSQYGQSSFVRARR